MSNDESDAPQKEVPPILEGLPEEQKAQVLQLLKLSVFSGPLPPPEAFEHYERTLPGAAQAILKMAQRNQEITAEGVSGQLRNERYSIVGGISLAVFTTLASGWAIHQGLEWPAAVGIGTTFGIVRMLIRRPKDD